MPGDNYKRVHSGERLQIPAAAWNDLLGMLAEWKRGGFAQRASGPELSKAPVKVRNATGVALGQFSVVKANGVTIDPDNNEEGFRRQVCLEGATPDAADNVVAILQRAAADGEVVPAVMTGESIALVNVSSAAHGYAAAANGETVLVSQAAAGPWRILWANGTGNGTWCVVRSESSTAAGIVARKNDGTYTATARQKISFKEGSNVTLTVADDATAGEIDVTIAAASGSLTVKESDGSPSVSSVDTIAFDGSDGLTVTDNGSGDVTVTVKDATASQAGIVNTGLQTFGGNKTIQDGNLTLYVSIGNGGGSLTSSCGGKSGDGASFQFDGTANRFPQDTAAISLLDGSSYCYCGMWYSTGAIFGIYGNSGTDTNKFAVYDHGASEWKYGATGSFTSGAGKTITVTGGIITNIQT